MSGRPTSLEELKEHHRAVWGSAPFENVAGLIADMHDALVARLAPRPGERWADLGCGTGEVAFRAARAGAAVTASDLSPVLLDTARRQASEQGLTLELHTADCERLPYPDGAFDVVSSSVGVIFAPDHGATAHELARICRPGGRVGLTAWREQGGVGRIFRTIAAFGPPPVPGAGSPFSWGDEGYVEELLGGSFDLSFEELDSPWVGDDPRAMWTGFRDNFGPAYTLWQALEPPRRSDLDDAMIALLDGARRPDGTVCLERRYLIVTGLRRRPGEDAGRRAR